MWSSAQGGTKESCSSWSDLRSYFQVNFCISQWQQSVTALFEELSSLEYGRRWLSPILGSGGHWFAHFPPLSSRLKAPGGLKSSAARILSFPVRSIIHGLSWEWWKTLSPFLQKRDQKHFLLLQGRWAKLATIPFPTWTFLCLPY